VTTRCGPGLVVTSDVRRRSTVVKLKIIKKSLADEDESEGRRRGVKMRKKKKKMSKGYNTTTSVVARDLILPPRSHVEVLETSVHGGRVRGRIAWEEEVAVELDPGLAAIMEEEELRARAMARPDVPSCHEGPGHRKGKSRKFFRRRSADAGGTITGELPFTSELFDRPPQHTCPGASRSRSPLTTIKYEGWVSLQWAGSWDNHERDLAMKRHRRRSAAAVDLGGGANFVSDEDEGPWSKPIALGVYRISGEDITASGGGVEVMADVGSSAEQLPLYEAADSESNIVDFLVCNQCLEVVETRVLVMRRRDGDQYRGASATAAGEGRRVVRARCMVPVVGPPPPSAEDYMNSFTASPGYIQGQGQVKRKFRSGWITLSEQGEGASPTAGVTNDVSYNAREDPAERLNLNGGSAARQDVVTSDGGAANKAVEGDADSDEWDFEEEDGDIFHEENDGLSAGKSDEGGEGLLKQALEHASKPLTPIRLTAGAAPGPLAWVGPGPPSPRRRT